MIFLGSALALATFILKIMSEKMMEDKSFIVDLKCLFCDCPLEDDAEKEYVSGYMLKFQECEELNDYEALIDVAAEEGKAIVAEYAKNEIEKIAKKMFKQSKLNSRDI